MASGTSGKLVIQKEQLTALAPVPTVVGRWRGLLPAGVVLLGVPVALPAVIVALQVKNFLMALALESHEGLEDYNGPLK